MVTREGWADAYFQQARSDWALFREFQKREDVPLAQALHYLQMATEKLAKAYRFRDTGADMGTLLTSHVGFHAFFNAFLLAPGMKRSYAGREEQRERIRRECGRIARAVELLAPAVDRSGSPGNAEYPWEAGGEIVAPVAWSFPDLSLLREAGGRRFLSFVEQAFLEYTQGRSGVASPSGAS